MKNLLALATLELELHVADAVIARAGGEATCDHLGDEPDRTEECEVATADEPRLQ